MTPSAAKWFGLLLVTLLLFGAVVPQTASAATCSGNCLVAGDYTIVSSGSGRVRTYLVHVPSSYAGAPVPLLLDLHGFSSNAFDERTYSGQLQQSEKRGFIAVWPQGEGFSWNGYGCCAVADLAHVDDVAFLRSVISEVKRRANIDSDRVYVTGISNGGGMAQRMACEAADVVRAVASVSFPLNYDRCAPSRPIGVTEIAGTADKTIPYAA
jgi:polyhydroxybutyrate depolymerase